MKNVHFILLERNVKPQRISHKAIQFFYSSCSPRTSVQINSSMEAKELFFRTDKEIDGSQQVLIGFSFIPETHDLFIRFLGSSWTISVLSIIVALKEKFVFLR